MQIRLATSRDIESWAKLRAELWPDSNCKQHHAEISAILAEPAGECVAFLEFSERGDIRAFAEAALRHDHVNGCESSPVAFLEGIYVRPDVRGKGIGARLFDAVRSWAKVRGCVELASDAHLDNLASHAFHKAMGLDETERVVYFRQSLKG